MAFPDPRTVGIGVLALEALEGPGEARHHLERGALFEMIALPRAENRRGAYAAAVVTGAAHQEAAGWFVDYLSSEAGQAAYSAHGFSVPN